MVFEVFTSCVGVGGCIFGLYLAIKGIVCLRQRNLKSGLSYLFVGTPLFLMLTAVMLPAIAFHPVSHKRVPCMSNLNSIWRACVMYSMDHEEVFPTSFAQITNVVQDPKTFICPRSGHKPGPLELVDEWTDYVLVTNVSADSSGKLKLILAYCKPENHENRGVNVVCVNGAGLWIDQEGFTNLTCNMKAHSRINEIKPQPTNAPYSSPAAGSNR